ncbi:MAG: ATP-binding protein [Erysipelotrichaceae bacterium]|nr:ATP-binding protein [Erysipelotrichaceae bacterium]
MAKLFMMTGVPASGKSYVSEKIAKRENAIIYSSDIVRKKLDMDPSSDKQNVQLFDIMYDMIQEELAKGNNVVLDSTNTYRKYRKPFLQSLSEETEVTGVLLMRQIENCLKANSDRDNSIDESVIRMMYEEYDIPLQEDGYDRFEIVYPDEDEFSLNEIEEDKPNIMAYRSMFLNNGMDRYEKLKKAQEMTMKQDKNDEE